MCNRRGGADIEQPSARERPLAPRVMASTDAAVARAHLGPEKRVHPDLAHPRATDLAGST